MQRITFWLMTSLFAGLVSSAMALTNPNFAPEQSYAGGEDEFPGPDGWILRDLEDRRALLSTVEFALVGQRVFWFESLTGGFGDNKLEQCMEVTDPADFAVTVPAWTATTDADLRVRINVEFYSGLADCLDRDNRLDDEEDDFRLQDDAETWTSFTLAAPAPGGASHARLSLRARDRTGAGNNPAEVPKFIYFDNLEVAGATLVNANFEDTTINEASFGQDQGPFGWTLRSVTEAGLVVAEASAEQGSAFLFSELDEGFGDNTVEQCVAIAALDPFVFDVSVWPNLSDSDLRVRLAADLYASLDDCLERDNRIDDPDFDFRTDQMTPETWNSLRSGLIDAPAAAAWARIALRARDRRGSGPDPVILFDRVALTDRFFVSGNLSGLADGAELTLANSGETLIVNANGAFVFPTGLAHAADYVVTVSDQPESPSQTCTVSAGSGQIDADDVTDVVVECTTDTFAIGGQVDGLEPGNSVVLQLNGDSTLTVSANEAFTFAEALPDASAYAVTVLEDPSSPDQTCTVANGEGVLAGSDIDDVMVTCATDTFTVGGNLQNLVAGTSVTLQNNAGDDLVLSETGPFTFSEAVADGAAYQISVLDEPTGPNQSCQVSNGTGVINGADVVDVIVDCQLESYPVGGSLSGLADGTSVTLEINDSETLALAANGAFQFPTELADGSAYAVAVIAQPTQPNQVCAVSNGSGNLAGGPVTNILIDCVTETYPVGGTLTGLASGASLVLQNNGTDNLTLTGNGGFEFASELEDGSAFAVTVLTQPATPSQTCTVSQGTGTINGAPVSSIQVNCATNSFLLGGMIDGLAADNPLTLTDGAGQSLMLLANGAFVFDQPLADGSSYAVSISQQPTAPAQLCTVDNGAGVIAGGDVTDIEINCQTDASAPPPPPGTGTATGMVPIRNAGFGLEQAFAGSGDEFPGPEGWIMRDLEDRRGLVSSINFARSGSRVFRFESLQSGFGDNKLDQCLPLTSPADFALILHAWSELSDPAVQVRVNVESYPTANDCLARSNRLDNEDFDFPLTAPATTWQALGLVLAIDPAATQARISIRVRDRSAAGSPAEPSTLVLIDDISVEGAELVNGDFEAGPLDGALFGEDFGPLGWTLRSVSEFGLIVPQPDRSENGAFQFTSLGDGFGDNTLEQCVPIDLNRFLLSAEVWPELRSSDLRIRLNVDLHANREDCLARDNRLSRHDTDFRTSGLVAASWNTIISSPISRPADARYARIALRARDRIDPRPASTPIILFDQVQIQPDVVAVPVNHPAALIALLVLMLGLGLRALAGPHRHRFSRLESES